MSPLAWIVLVPAVLVAYTAGWAFLINVIGSKLNHHKEKP